MRIFLAVLVLIFGLQSWTKADDIRDFQIEGMSIGDSLLDHMDITEIKELMQTDYPKSKKFSRLTKIFPNMTTYEDVMFHFKTKDKKYIIYSVDGGFYYENNFKGCEKKKDEIVEDISKQFSNLKKIVDNGTHSYDNESLANSVYFYFQNGDQIEISCYDWTDKVTKELNFADNLTIRLSVVEFVDWINDEAYD